ncbi:type III pantothenate kinase [Agaribacterium sp. ZY112]|uniref:type III pantothenate kinase n=1 Tax=Agaribacterium sp. ZY112 TaxID=3233574 RepID=UPI00352556FF
MILDLDQGNTALKWRITDKGRCLKEGVGQLDLLARDIAGMSFSAVYLANVAGIEREAELRTLLAGSLSAIYSDGVCVAKVVDGLHGLELAYADVSSLGVDRWLIMLALWRELASAFTVVSCGTAVTVDRVNALGRHEGGMIAPGWSLLERAVSDGMANIDVGVNLAEKKQVWGVSTSECVGLGVTCMYQSFITSIMSGFKSDESAIIMCGGGVDSVKHLLPASGQLRSNLVLDGLALLRLGAD